MFSGNPVPEINLLCWMIVYFFLTIHYKLVAYCWNLKLSFCVSKIVTVEAVWLIRSPFRIKGEICLINEISRQERWVGKLMYVSIFSSPLTLDERQKLASGSHHFTSREKSDRRQGGTHSWYKRNDKKQDPTARCIWNSCSPVKLVV